MEQTIWGILSAYVGAGFASGREIMQFFSRWGPLSWPLIALAAGLMTALMLRVMEGDASAADALNEGKFRLAGRMVMIPLLVSAGGAMTAAAGELAALTLPVRGARAWGGLTTLALCGLMSVKPLKALSMIGRLLLPALAAALILCLRSNSGAQPSPVFSFPQIGAAAIQAAGYAGVNGLLALGVLRDAGKGRGGRERKRIAWRAGLLFALLLGMSNAVFLRHAGELGDAALPMVLLLKRYGKTGYALSAVVLYLAVVSTLIAALRGLRTLLPGRYPAVGAAVLAALASQLGFRDIVGKAYPVLGLLGLILLSAPKNFPNHGTNRRPGVL